MHGSENVKFGTGTRYGMDGPGIEFRWRRDFSRLWIGPGANSTSYTMGVGSFPEVKRPGRGVDLPLPSYPEVRERVELYFYTPAGASWPIVW